mmetsp:Transcript_22693/g.37548  ORF Transcript_22693/g.37548 Transcript_22693/m.37548 type:complete len:173 (-) Transcript_22693:158-676(-)
MCSPVDEMKALTISPQASEDSALATLISFDRLNFKSSLADVSEIDESVSSDFSTSDTDQVFREGSRSIVEDMFFVLKRANPVTDYRDDPDIVGYPMAKRKRRTYHYGDDDNTSESDDEREGVEEIQHDAEEYSADQNEDEEALSQSTTESRQSLQSMSNILGVLQEANRVAD